MSSGLFVPLTQGLPTKVEKKIILAAKRRLKHKQKKKFNKKVRIVNYKSSRKALSTKILQVAEFADFVSKAVATELKLIIKGTFLHAGRLLQIFNSNLMRLGVGVQTIYFQNKFIETRTKRAIKRQLNKRI